MEDPELRFTSNGVPVAWFTVASTPRTFDREADTWRDGEPTFLDCTAWRHLAENLAASARKGPRPVVAGRLRTERWETPEGEKRSKMVTDADEVAASMTFATVAITRNPRTVPPQATAPDDPRATASPTRPAPPPGADAPHGQEPPF
ncbi:single-stranded DNA-binding protein [Streptomyces sp. 1222.5]|uniref:single-stranded DNA-binding protein n=1 Tax=Streptomyces sp. 1222.5 TaxID=1881026 RepID=UPI003D724414